jgi:purine nucleoside phosphorylase
MSEFTVRTEKKIKRKMGKCDVSGMSSADTIAVVSEHEAKVYRVSLHKRRLLADFDSVPFGHVKDE